jgi:hypothetical protein
MGNPEAGDLIEGTGGLRKVHFGDARRAATAALARYLSAPTEAAWEVKTRAKHPTKRTA